MKKILKIFNNCFLDIFVVMCFKIMYIYLYVYIEIYIYMSKKRIYFILCVKRES